MARPMGSFAVRSAALVALLGVSPAPSPASAEPLASRGSVAARGVAPPLRFEPNLGQAAAGVLFTARARGTSLFLTADGATLVRRGAQRSVTMRVKGARAGVEPRARADGELEGRSNYLIGADASRWQTGVTGYRRVTYADVLPGVDEVFHGGDGGALEYDFIVAPGAAARSIELSFDGADALTMGVDGALEIHAGGMTLVQPRPLVFQRVGEEDVAVDCAYRLTGATSVAFDLGAFDPGKTLRIDPVLAYSTYLGGAGDDYAYGIAVDSAGAIYVTGFTSSAGFPTADAVQATLTGSDDVFVTKLSPTGTELVYSTFLGGSAGAYGRGIAVDASGSAYVVGSTDSPDFPATQALQPALAGAADAFVAKLTPDGSSLAYSTFLGGVGNDYGYGVAVDGAGAAYVVGSTDGPDPNGAGGGFPIVGGVQPAFDGVTDAFVAKIQPDGASLAYSTYLGGALDDEGRGIAVDSAGVAYVTGYTSSVDFPTAAGGDEPGVDAGAPLQSLNNGTENAFVAALSPAGSRLVYSTYLGGSELDQGHAIAVDATGAAYVTGLATSPDFPTEDAFQAALGSVTGGTSAFVTKLEPTGTALAYSTFLGGSGGDSGEAIAVSSAGAAYVTGFTGSPNFPTTNAFQPANGANASMGTNAFLAGFPPHGGGAGGDAGAGLLYSTYLGGSVGDSAEAVALGPAGAYVAGYTVSPDFPTVGPIQATLASPEGDNAFVAVVGPATLVADAGPGVKDAGAADVGASVVPNGAYDAAEPGPAEAGAAPATASGDGCTCRASSRGGDGGGGVMFAVGVAAVMGVRRRRRRTSVGGELRVLRQPVTRVG